MVCYFFLYSYDYSPVIIKDNLKGKYLTGKQVVRLFFLILDFWRKSNGLHVITSCCLMSYVRKNGVVVLCRALNFSTISDVVS